mmetsp:Transcript_7568/g.8607  ORF Transcript_7568/g.8607 Transcript_7568/m.8607 type:complete len:146 (+) Transcript_7568:85-522(+)|eukprot:CAMPEP_0205819064 /NCGR_PEP_ID=MMETSP0206-20130828/1253_1 /ASSEMBLY_ACC=CAM_ASM_000279 /TAXON_ID=36767 /ORGANISM="Euplotes focardii, Strain TN1" /LENGTH=145 /DNA_ID=CAMNT_0053112155 /DNA_START=82 /DNA_END=519 /DNA_ORIENTATION=+
MASMSGRALWARGNPRKVTVMGRAKRGLYHQKHIQFGNTVSHSHHKERRTWKPNVFKKRFRSDLLKETIQVQVTTSALRCIDKAGGFDNYLLNTRPKWLGPSDGAAMHLRQRLKEAKARCEAQEAEQEVEQEPIAGAPGALRDQI